MTDDQISDIASPFLEWTEQGYAITDKTGFARALLAAGASEGQADQKPRAWLIDPRTVLAGTTFVIQDRFEAERYAQIDSLKVTPLYAYPSAEIAALRERIANPKLESELRSEINELRERIAGMEKDAERWRELKEHTRETEIRRGCTASAFGQPNWLLNYGTMDYTLDAYIEIRARKARQDASSVASKEEPHP